MKKIFAFLLALTFVFGAASISAYAENTPVDEFIFSENVPAEIREMVIADILGEDDDEASTYGILCDLLGHKYETSYVTRITHNVRTTAPRCLERYYKYEICSRCDDTVTTLVKSEYIYCC